MSIDQAVSIKKYLKGHITVGRKLKDVYDSYIKGKEENPLNLEDFEEILVILGSRLINNLTTKIVQYKKDQIDYDKFIREQEFVSKKFWDSFPDGTDKTPVSVLKESPPEHIKDTLKTNYERLLPTNWTGMDKNKRIDFVKKVQHKGFHAYLLSIDKDVDDYFKKVPATSNPVRFYVTLFQFPRNEHSEEAKKLLKNFVKTLNMMGRAKLQYVECSSPNIVEIREVR